MNFFTKLSSLSVVCALVSSVNAATYTQGSPEYAAYTMTDNYIKVANKNSVFDYKSVATSEFLTSYEELQKEVKKVEDQGEIALEADIFLNAQDYSDISNYSFKAIEKNNDSASVLLSSKQGSEFVYNCFQLKLVNGEWKLNDLINIYPENENDAIKKCPLTTTKPLKELIDSLKE